jgi:GNAT superfamily N-acetyltransferase
MAEITVLRANLADRDDLLELLAAQLTEHAIKFEPKKLASAIDGALKDAERGIFVVARAEEVAVGAAYLSFTWSLEHTGKSCWLEELYVTPDRRGKGIGTRLLKTAIDHAREMGCAAMDLEVESKQSRAAHLYEREGFRVHSRARWVKPLR